MVTAQRRIASCSGSWKVKLLCQLQPQGQSSVSTAWWNSRAGAPVLCQPGDSHCRDQPLFNPALCPKPAALGPHGCSSTRRTHRFPDSLLGGFGCQLLCSTLQRSISSGTAVCRSRWSSCWALPEPEVHSSGEKRFLLGSEAGNGVIKWASSKCRISTWLSPLFWMVLEVSEESQGWEDLKRTSPSCFFTFPLCWGTESPDVLCSQMFQRNKKPMCWEEYLKHSQIH